MIQISCVWLGVYAVLGTALTLNDMPLLKQLPSEVLFRDHEEVVVECVTEGKEGGVSYKWLKNGQPFTPQSDVVQRANEGTLAFKKPTKRDEGMYQCLAETEHGVSITRVNLKRTFIDKPRVELKNHKPIEGESYKLECDIPNSYPKPEILWVYQSLADPTASRDILDRRITSSPEGDLYFSNVTVEDTSDSFKYVCVARSKASDTDVVLAEHVLDTVVRSSGPKNNELYPLYVSNDFTATVGSVTMIFCIYGGTPLAYPDWYKDGRNVNHSVKGRVTRYNRSSGKRLLIKQTRLEDQGTYTCLVDNEDGKPNLHTMRLTVVSAPQFAEQPGRKLTVQLGEDLVIHCQIAGVPSPKLTWTHNTRDLPQVDRLQIQQSCQDNVTVAVLTVKNVLQSDSGIYGCLGQNPYGEIYAETLVIVQ